ncbi:MAG: hypothetical protein M3X11_01510 [Acidobacteriota bacterium]|nr:hypothetical protein [Acidobacteriota bacterium]
MFDSDDLRNPAWLISGVLLSAFAVWGSPFLIDYLNSGDQLPPTLQLIDPQLFPNDQIVAAMGKLKSGFYLALAAAMKLFHIQPQQTVPVMHALFIASKLLLIASVFAVCRSLKKSFWFFAIFAAWCCHQKPALLGSVTLFMPLITHNEVALVMGLFAITCLLRERMIMFWLLAGLMVMVHVLVGLQFMLCFAPALLWQRKLDKSFLIGAGLFGICCAAYLITMAPAVMSVEEWQLFLSTNGNTGHISLIRNGWLDWFGFVSFFGLALAAFNRFLKGNAGFELLWRAAIGGSVIGLLLSLTAVLTQAMRPMLFQPMRVFFWVTLICFLLIAAATVEAFKQSRLAGTMLASVLVLTVLNSLLAPLFAFLGLGYFVAERLAERFGESVQKIVGTAARAALMLGVAGIFAAWALGSRQPVGSLRSPVLLLPGVVCLAVLFLPSLKILKINWQTPVAVALIIYCLTTISIYRYNYAERWLDADWRTVRQWCRMNTQPSDHFVTPPDQIGFRVLALRSTASEALPRLIWSAPFTYLENKLSAERAAKGYGNNSTDPAYLFELAREWRCDYVIARGSYDAKFTPLFRSGEYSVLRTPDQYRD